MILDIKFTCKDGRPPIQLQGVRQHTTYPNARMSPDNGVVVVHFQEFTKGPLYLELDSIESLQVSND